MMARSAREWRQVYFIEAADLGLVKIGCADNVKARLATLQTGSPVKLSIRGVYHTDDAPFLEAGFHQQFAHLREHGEWFRLDDELAEVSKGFGEPDEDRPVGRMVRHPHLHPPSEPAVIVPWRSDDTMESYAGRVFKICHALEPETFVLDAEPA